MNYAEILSSPYIVCPLTRLQQMKWMTEYRALARDIVSTTKNDVDIYARLFNLELSRPDDVACLYVALEGRTTWFYQNGYEDFYTYRKCQIPRKDIGVYIDASYNR